MMKQTAFTLIEVLIALLIIAIALTALIKVTSQNVATTSKLKDKAISHWVAMQGVTALQLNLVRAPLNQEITEVTHMFGQRFYWRAKLLPTPIKSMQKIIITVSQQQDGPFTSPLIAFRFTP